MSFILLLLLAVLTAVHSFDGLSFDPENYLCAKFEPLCENLLEEIGCESHKMEGCPGYPTVPNNITHFVGQCTCLSPVYYDLAGTRVTQQIIANRIVPDMYWLMEPWNSGPPYDIKKSYKIICDKTLGRLGCPEEDRTIVAVDAGPNNFKCACGKLTTGNNQINNIIMDKLNDINLKQMPIFSNPVYLSVPISICITLICGKLGAIIAVYFKLPPIIGFLLAGLGIQNILSPMFLKGAGYPYPSPASEIKTIALLIVLMRAGLSIKFEEITQNSVASSTLSLIPYMCEFFMFMYAGQHYFGWSTIDMGLFASIMAALGPSVVISGLLNLVAHPKKDFGYAPKQVLISTPIEAVIAIVLFGIFATLEQTTTNPLFPWVKVLPLYANCLLIPVNILFSTVLGIVTGWLASKYINYRVKIKTDFIWVRISKNPQMGSSTADLVFVLVVLCYTMMSLCTMQYIQQCSGVLVVFVACITVSKLTKPEVCVDIAQGLKGIWLFAEVFLFTLTGTSLSFDSSNGPLYGQRGLDSTAMQKVLGVMFLGISARIVGLGASMLIMLPGLPEHRKQWKWLLPFWANCWIFQMPKATVQATLGSVAYYSKIIPGPSGINKGLFIAQASAFTVLIFAPLGSLLTNYVGKYISQYLTQLDNEAGWNQEKGKYKTPSDPSVSECSEDKEDKDYGVELTDLQEPETIESIISKATHDVMDILHNLTHSDDKVYQATKTDDVETADVTATTAADRATEVNTNEK